MVKSKKDAWLGLLPGGITLIPPNLRRRIKKVVAVLAVVMWCIACIGLHYWMN